MCGVFGIRSLERDVARLSYFALFALQHRGQESAGIAVSEDGRLTVLRDMGLVAQVFNEATLATLQGDLAIGHTRYSTTGSTTWDNAQPVFKNDGVRALALGHNGNLVNTGELVARLGRSSTATTDSDLVAGTTIVDDFEGVSVTSLDVSRGVAYDVLLAAHAVVTFTPRCSINVAARTGSSLNRISSSAPPVMPRYGCNMSP